MMHKFEIITLIFCLVMLLSMIIIAIIQVEYRLWKGRRTKPLLKTGSNVKKE